MSTKTIVVASITVAILGTLAYKVNKFKNDVVKAFNEIDAASEKAVKETADTPNA